MKKLFFLIPVLCVLLTACENYSTTSNPPSGQPNRGTDAAGRPTRDQHPNPNQPGNPDMNRNQQGR